MNADTVAQVGITVFGIAAIILVARKNKWGFVVGLMAQPFFLTTAYLNEQWGLFFVSVIYTFTWSYGIYEWFYKNKSEKTETTKK